MILHPSFVLPVMPGETPVGYASRLALRIGCALPAFCKHIGITMQQLLDGAHTAIAMLCDACQLPHQTFSDTTYVVTPDHRIILAGEEFSADQVSREALRICPVCVQQQMAAGKELYQIWAPREWYLTPLYVCDVHSVPILAINKNDLGRGRQDFSALLQQAVLKGHLRERKIESVSESGLGQHIRRRLRGVDDRHWLSRIPLYAAIRTADLIGVAALHGVQQAWQDLDAAGRFEAGRAGYEILSDGNLGLRNLFSQFQQAHSGDSSKAELLLTFGRIHVAMLSWRHSAFDPLRDVLRQHLCETMAFGPGDVLYGKEITAERRIHSARTAAPELGLSPATAHKRLRHIGVLAERTDTPTWNQTFFDARIHASDMRRLSGALQRAEAIRYLGLERLQEGYSPILDMIGSMNVDKTSLINQIFAREDLDAFLTSILGKASNGPTDGFEPISQATRRLRTPIANALDLIRKGEITDIRVSPQHKGIRSLMVRKRDLYAALVATRPWITMVAGAKAIRMREVTLSALVNAKIIPSKGAMPMMLNIDDLKAFTRTYVSRWEVARAYRTLRCRQNRFSMVQAISMAGLKRAFNETNPLLQFYKRDEVLAAFGPPPP
jgi:hypothetical protein